MKLRIAISYSDGRREVVPVNAKIEVEMERKFGRPLHECNTHENFYYMGWLALRAASKESSDFEGFLDIVREVELLDETDPESADTVTR